MRIGDEKRQEAFGFQTGDPAFEQGAFSGAGMPGEHHDATPGGRGVEQREDLPAVSGGEELADFVIGGERDAAQAPGPLEFLQGGSYGTDSFSAHSCFPSGAG